MSDELCSIQASALTVNAMPECCMLAADEGLLLVGENEIGKLFRYGPEQISHASNTILLPLY